MKDSSFCELDNPVQSFFINFDELETGKVKVWICTSSIPKAFGVKLQCFRAVNFLVHNNAKSVYSAFENGSLAHNFKAALGYINQAAERLIVGMVANAAK